MSRTATRRAIAFGSGVGPLAVPVPVLGAELVTNGDMETGDPPTGWVNSGV